MKKEFDELEEIDIVEVGKPEQPEEKIEETEIVEENPEKESKNNKVLSELDNLIEEMKNEEDDEYDVLFKEAAAKNISLIEAFINLNEELSEEDKKDFKETVLNEKGEINVELDQLMLKSYTKSFRNIMEKEESLRKIFRYVYTSIPQEERIEEYEFDRNGVHYYINPQYITVLDESEGDEVFKFKVFNLGQVLTDANDNKWFNDDIEKNTILREVDDLKGICKMIDEYRLKDYNRMVAKKAYKTALNDLFEVPEEDYTFLKNIMNDFLLGKTSKNVIPISKKRLYERLFKGKKDVPLIAKEALSDFMDDLGLVFALVYERQILGYSEDIGDHATRIKEGIFYNNNKYFRDAMVYVMLTFLHRRLSRDSSIKWSINALEDQLYNLHTDLEKSVLLYKMSELAEKIK